MNTNWAELAREIEKVSGYHYGPKALASVDFCCRELGRLGFSMRIRYYPKWEWEWEQERAGNGLPPPTKEEAEKWGEGKYCYQLKGGPIEEPGAHSSPLVNTPEEAAATALFNVCRLYINKKGGRL